MSDLRRRDAARPTRERLLATARELFGRDGYEATSVEAVLGEAGVARGSLYHHFENKPALFDAVLDQVVARDRRARPPRRRASHDDPVEGLRAGCARLAAHGARPRGSADHARRRPGRASAGRAGASSTSSTRSAACAAASSSSPTSGRLPAAQVDVLAHMLLAAVSEAALLIPRADDPEAALAAGLAAFDTLLDRLAGALAERERPPASCRRAGAPAAPPPGSCRPPRAPPRRRPRSTGRAASVGRSCSVAVLNATPISPEPSDAVGARPREPQQRPQRQPAQLLRRQRRVGRAHRDARAVRRAPAGQRRRARGPARPGSRGRRSCRAAARRRGGRRPTREAVPMPPGKSKQIIPVPAPDAALGDVGPERRERAVHVADRHRARVGHVAVVALADHRQHRRCRARGRTPARPRGRPCPPRACRTGTPASRSPRARRSRASPVSSPTPLTTATPAAARAAPAAPRPSRRCAGRSPPGRGPRARRARP